MNPLLDTAIQYRRMGLSVVPIISHKRPLGAWITYQKRQMTEQEIMATFIRRYIRGIGIVCGAVSGGFEGLDIDNKNDPAGTLTTRFIHLLRKANPVLAAKLVEASTKNNGHHLYYKSPAITRSMILARRPSTQVELVQNPNVKVRILMETRGEGGYIIVPPSTGYAFLRQNLFGIAAIDLAERSQLLSIARSFNQLEEQVRARPFASSSYSRNGSPLLDFNQRGDVIGLLKRHGWVVVDDTSERTVFRRPGHTDHWSSGDYHHTRRLFSVFTTSTEFIPRKGYTPAAVFAVLECQGNYRLAAKRLIELGYGIPYRFIA